MSFENVSTTAVLVGVLFGALNCFLGYRVLKYWTALLGALVGGLLGAVIASAFDAAAWIVVVAALALAILCGLAAFRIYQLGVMLVCGVGGVVLACIVLDLLPDVPSAVSVAVLIVAFLLFGAMGLHFLRPMIILSSGLSGGASIVNLLFQAFGQQSDSWPCLALGLALGVLGCVVQFRVTARDKAPGDTQAK